MALLDGKKALVAGVANKKSIAWAIARGLHEHGAEIAFMCLETNVRRVKKLAAQISSSTIMACDVRDDESIEAAFAELAKAFDGQLDIMVHAIAFADINDLGGEFVEVSRDGWNLALEVSAYSLVAFCRQARPLMKKAGGGSIMTLSFAGGEKVVPGYNIMGVAKAALDMSVRYLAYDLGPDGIRVNAISPGPIATLSSQVIEDFDVALRRMESCSPLLRNVTGEDVAGTAVYLSSALGKSVTGSVIKVDSGMHIMCAPTELHRVLK